MPVPVLAGFVFIGKPQVSIFQDPNAGQSEKILPEFEVKARAQTTAPQKHPRDVISFAQISIYTFSEPGLI